MPGLLDLVAKLVDLGLLRVVLAQLALDRLELLAQDVLALGLVELRLDLALDLALQLEDLDLAVQERRDELEALDDVDRLEELLALLGRHVGAVGDHVGEQAGLGDVAGGDGRLRRHGCARLDVLLDLGLDRLHQRLDLEVLRGGVRQLLHGRHEVRAGRHEAVHAEPALALHDGTHGSVLELDHLGDLGERADRVELGGVADLLRLGAPLGHQRDQAPVGDGRVERVDALLATHLERHDHLREDDRLAKRDERQLAGPGLGRTAARPSSVLGITPSWRVWDAGAPRFGVPADRPVPPSGGALRVGAGVVPIMARIEGAVAGGCEWSSVSAGQIPCGPAGSGAVVSSWSPAVHSSESASRIRTPRRSSSSKRIRTPARLTPRSWVRCRIHRIRRRSWSE